jgi:hypothetical protein
VQQYSLTLQREVFRNTVVQAAYVGTHGVKLFMVGVSPFFPGPTASHPARTGFF